MFKGITNEPLDMKRIMEIEQELRKNPHFADDSVKIVKMSAKELYDDIVEHGGSYDIEGELETLRKMVEEEKTVK